MITLTSGMVFLTFLVFCRVGSCIMLMPGFGSPRIPPQVRLFLAVSTTLALAPILVPALDGELGKASIPAMSALIISEIFAGVMIGAMGRMFMLALEFAGAVVANMIGLAGVGTPIEENEPQPSVATLMTLTATVLVFSTGLHVEMLRALVASYDVIKAGSMLDVRFALSKISDASSSAFMLTAQIAGPFLVFSIVANFLFGILNKLTPMIPVYFISGPFLIAGGLSFSISR